MCTKGSKTTSSTTSQSLSQLLRVNNRLEFGLELIQFRVDVHLFASITEQIGLEGEHCISGLAIIRCVGFTACCRGCYKQGYLLQPAS